VPSNAYRNRIRDAVHGFIRLSDSEVRFIDFPEFQRLRRIRQLALTSFVYPGAVHTRFEHSLGVMQLVTRMFHNIQRNTEKEVWNHMVFCPLKNIDLDESRALEVLRLAALLHDIGHLPFSHVGEGILPKGIKHEHVSVEIAKELEHRIDALSFKGATEMAILLIIPDEAMAPTELSFLRKILSGAIDADRCDYLMRDSLHCGVTYGVFDIDRLVESLIIIEKDGIGELGVEKGGVHAVEALILARYYMYSQVYFHRTRRLFDKYLTDFLKQAIGTMEKDNLLTCLEWDDLRVMECIRQEAESRASNLKDLASRLWYRGADYGKHKMVFESNGFLDEEAIGEIISAFQGVKSESDGRDLFLDEAPGDIHRFYIASEEKEKEEGELFWVQDSRQNNISLITDASRVIRNMPKKFRLIRIYGMGSDMDLKALKTFLQPKGEGNQCGVWHGNLRTLS
jgi:HD superfamily phosphohydrolase